MTLSLASWLRALSHAAGHPGRFAAPLALGGALLLASACGEEDPECETDSECQEITCPDGSKMQRCGDGNCLVGTDCPKTSGGW